MNNGAQGGQPPQGQAAGAQQQQNQQRRQNPPMLKPEHLRNLPEAFSSEKDKWEQGLRSLWSQAEKNPPDSPAHQEAKRKIMEFSKTLTGKMQLFRMQQQQGQQGGAARPNSQNQHQQTQGGESSGGNPNAEQQAKAQQQQQPQVRGPSAKIVEHANKFPYVLPTGIEANTPDGQKWISDTKNRYMKGLVAMETATARLAALEGAVQKRNEDGKPLNPDEEKDYKEKKAQMNKGYSDAKNFVENFRSQQQQARNARDGQQAQQGGQQNATASANQQGNSTPQAGAQQNAANSNGNSGTGQTAPTRPQMNPQQIQNPALHNTQTVNAAIEAARNQQIGGPRPSLSQNGQMSQAPQLPMSSAPSNNAAQQTPSQGQNQNQTQSQSVKTESGLPQINTAITQLQQGQGQQRLQNSPQSAIPQSAGAPQSATSQANVAQVPRALTHSAALSQAARSYSNGGQVSSTPHVMGHSHPSAPREAQNVITNKMPIPKHLHDRALAQPQPVSMNQSRPTFSGGPGNSGNGVMSQPVLTKIPQYNMAGDEGRVLSRKKLDELVKQVTGGGQGDGPSLTPEVEESMLTVADTFVDQVLHNACKMAKERGSKSLEIRDIQLTLERNYNIRIPGYASDEIRTVRKIQPAPAWIAKMSAVQAAKVTGGKNAD